MFLTGKKLKTGIDCPAINKVKEFSLKMRKKQSTPPLGLMLLTIDEMKQLNEKLAYSTKDTLSCWKATRLNKHSPSSACGEGNISNQALKMLDEAFEEWEKLRAKGDI